ncbi:MAG: hypothetical protein ABTQ34_06550 [Bdellovibrionales bacterium]
MELSEAQSKYLVPVADFKKLTCGVAKKWIDKGVRSTDELLQYHGSLPAAFVGAVGGVVLSLRDGMDKAIDPAGRCLHLQTLLEYTAALIALTAMMGKTEKSLDQSCKALSASKIAYMEQSYTFCKMDDVYMRSIGLPPVEEIYASLAKGRLPKAMTTRIKALGHKFEMGASPWIINAMLGNAIVEQGLRRPTSLPVRMLETWRKAASEELDPRKLKAVKAVASRMLQSWKNAVFEMAGAISPARLVAHAHSRLMAAAYRHTQRASRIPLA